MTDIPAPTPAVQCLSPLAEKDRALVLFDLLEDRRHAKSMTGTVTPDRSLNTFFEWALPRTGEAKAQLFQDLWVLWELGGKRDGYFCEFGATNGVDLSNSHLLENTFGWSGILAEPNPAYHDRLAQERGCHISHDCVHSESGRTLPFLCAVLPHLSRLSDIVPEDSHEARGRRQVQQMIDVPTISLNDLLDSFGAPDHIDYISVDTEGSEFEILKHFDFSRRTVTLFTVEHNGTPLRRDIFELLTGHGYERRFPEYTRFDDWYIRPDLA